MKKFFTLFLSIFTVVSAFADRNLTIELTNPNSASVFYSYFNEATETNIEGNVVFSGTSASLTTPDDTFVILSVTPAVGQYFIGYKSYDRRGALVASQTFNASGVTYDVFVTSDVARIVIDAGYLQDFSMDVTIIGNPFDMTFDLDGEILYDLHSGSQTIKFNPNTLFIMIRPLKNEKCFVAYNGEVLTEQAQINETTMKIEFYYYSVYRPADKSTLLINLEDATQVEELEAADAADADVYDLNGVCVGSDLEALPAGLYIVGGEKVLKK